MARRAFVSRFSPNRTDPAVLEAIFVQRHHLADVWLERLRDSVLTQTRHHLLAVGPRGCGKSHLVVLLLHRLRQDPEVTEKVRIAWLPEDETTPSFWKFLLRILRALNAEYGDEFPPPPRDRLNHAKDADRGVVLTEYLLEKLGDRVLLVVVENLDDVMRGLGLEGQKRWRAFLQEKRVAATLATAQQLTKDLSARDRPFFNFFQIEPLLPLAAEEALLLLQKLAEQSNNPRLAEFLHTPVGRARVRAIRHLTGGSHRVFIILSEFATRENMDELVSAFEELLDELTPYYQERLRWLPDQQREIVEFLCRQDRTVQVKGIAGELFLSEQGAAAQLKVLRDKGYVTTASVGRESRYELAEPLMRLCVEIKDPQREPIRLIVDFLRVWYDRNVVESQLGCLPSYANLERSYFQAVLTAHKLSERDPIQVALERDIQTARDSNDGEELVRVLMDLGMISDDASYCVTIGRELIELKRYAEALSVCKKTLDANNKYSPLWVLNGLALAQVGQFGEALNSFDNALKITPSSAPGWLVRGIILSCLGKEVEAIDSYERSLNLNPTTANAWFMKGVSLARMGRHAEAITAYDQGVLLGQDDMEMYELRGKSNYELGRIDYAAIDFSKAISRNSFAPEAFVGVGLTYLVQGNWSQAIQFLKEGIRLAPKSSREFLKYLGTFLADLFRSPIDTMQLRACVRELADFAHETFKQWNNSNVVFDTIPPGNTEKSSAANFVSLIGYMLVPGLLGDTYADADAVRVKEWEEAWQEAAERHPDLSFSVRVFVIGLRYVQTGNERVLLNLVQEERAILRDLFGLDVGKRQE
jgi:tetratricopeptide (TPR) repeat protein